MYEVLVIISMKHVIRSIFTNLAIIMFISFKRIINTMIIIVRQEIAGH